MKLQICGAAETVTGSCHLLTLENDYKLLLDCGLYQGADAVFDEFNHQWFFKPDEIDALILSHAHIDHCGRIPKLVKDGFKGKIICTSATRDLAAIMLLDSAHIQEGDAEYEAKKYGGKFDPLYTEWDVKQCLRYFYCVEYDNWFNVTNEVSLLFSDAGHILGSASVTLKIKEAGRETFFGFTGDVGRYNRPILKDPVPMPQLDYLICESTYGGKTHDETPENDDHFMQIIYDTCVAKRGKLIIPAFSLGRTQEILYRLDKLYNSGRLQNINVYVDSPLAMNATEIYTIHPECFDNEIHHYMSEDDSPFGWNNMRYVRKADQSKQLNVSDEPCIIIAASGMANAGRVKHHLYHQIEKAENTVLIVGYCAEGTLGQQLVQKPDTVTIFHQEKRVRAQIEVMSSMSAHADEPELLKFLANQQKEKLKKIFLVHGETKRQAAFKITLQNNQFKNVEIPKLGDIFELE
ncbi:MAG: MBL fold metallo-hydrolase [Sphingobacteriales bacterium]|nr:MBL fold metallo-hydrolase [Sphingobacteriales bacterium]